jgi:hypothetical protein
MQVCLPVSGIGQPRKTQAGNKNNVLNGSILHPCFAIFGL